MKRKINTKKMIRAVGVIFEDDNEYVLVLRRHKASREGDTWGLVGGNIDDGENSQQAAIRETREEIAHNISVEELKFIKSYSWEHEDAHIAFDVFRYKIIRAKVNIQLDKNENTEYSWKSPRVLHQRGDLMKGLYSILEDLYEV